MVTRLLLHSRPRRVAITPFLHLFPPNPLPLPLISSPVLCKVTDRIPAYGSSKRTISIHCIRFQSFHTSQPLRSTDQSIKKPGRNTENVALVDATNVKRKKLKGKRAVVKWVKQFRWKKKKEYERMTAEEKILFKLKKAEKKEARLVEAMRKIEPSGASEPTHDPEILTPEEHFYFLKMGQKCKNYVPIGRRGIFQGVILNMHLHWKKHQTLKVVVKTFTSEEVQEIAVELATLSGGIVLEINKDDEIIMYRGKNYSQPPTEIMSPRVTLSRKKALDMSKYKDALRAVRRFIPRLHQDLEDLQLRMKREGENKVETLSNADAPDGDHTNLLSPSQSEKCDGLEGRETRDIVLDKDDKYDTFMRPASVSESEDLSDVFETDTDLEREEADKPLYLDQIDMFPSEEDEEPENFEEQLRQISAKLKNGNSSSKDTTIEELDDIDKIFLRASSLLKKRKRR